jgi:hypothetical protein
MCVHSATEIDGVSSQKSGIPVPLHIIVDRDSLSGDQKDPEGFVETEDYVELNGISNALSRMSCPVMHAFTWTHSALVDASLSQVMQLLMHQLVHREFVPKYCLLA